MAAILPTLRGSPFPCTEAFDGFVREVRQRLEAGRREYGDQSFQRPPAELVQELQQEGLRAVVSAHDSPLPADFRRGDPAEQMIPGYSQEY